MSATVYDYSKLRGKIAEVFGRQKEFAKAMNTSPQTISYKMNGTSEWSHDEMEKAIDLLYIPPEEIHVYFFTKKVENISTMGGNTTNDC